MIMDQGSSIGGTNVGINGFISNEHKKAAVTAIKYMTSLEGQKEYMIKTKELSAINALYNDKDVCEVIECDLIKKIQPIARPSLLTENYDEYSSQLRNYFYEFLYGNKTASEALRNIYNIINIYDVSMNPSKNTTGFLIFITTILIITFMILSLIFLFIPKYKKYFSFINVHSWLIMIVGFIMILSVIFTQYGTVTKFKCQLKFILNSFGYTFISVPILHRLLINFPEENKLFTWLNNSKCQFFLIFILYDIIFNSLLFITSFKITDVFIKDGENYQICEIENKLGLTLMTLVIIEKGLILFSISFLLFLEWNIKATEKDIKLQIPSLFMNILLIISIILIKNITINSYIARFSIFCIINIIFVVSYYFFTYGIRIFFLIFLPYKQSDEVDIDKVRSFCQSSKISSRISKSEISTKSSKKLKIISTKILQYHYYTGEKEENNGIISSKTAISTNGERSKDIKSDNNLNK